MDLPTSAALNLNLTPEDNMQSAVIVFDTETTGLPNMREPASDDRQPRLVQLAWAILEDGRTVRARSEIIAGVEVPADAARIHGITTDMAARYGQPADIVLRAFGQALESVPVAVAHNLAFDAFILQSAALRAGMRDLADILKGLKAGQNARCTMSEHVGVVESRYADGRLGKYPKLTECHAHYFGTAHESQHDALGDVQATARVYRAMIEANAAREPTLPGIV